MHPKLQAALAIDDVWAIYEPSAYALLEKIEAVSEIEASELMPQRRDQKAPLYEMVGNVAIIAISDVMTKKPSSMASIFGGTSTIEVAESFRAALRDPKVSKILLKVDSPGGQADGSVDLADIIFKASEQKPVWCFADGMMGSAAYLVGCQAEKLFATQTTLIGSISCITALKDTSEQAERAGVKIHAIKSGKYKGTGIPGVKITDEQIAEVQRNVDTFHALFIDAVARGRGASDDRINEWATGAMWIGEEAKDLGLIDGIATLEEVLSQMQSGLLTARAAATAGNLTRGEHTMAKAPSFAEKFLNFLKGEGFDPEAAGGGEAQPNAATNAQTTQASEKTEATVTASAIDPAIKEQIDALAQQNAAQGKQLAAMRDTEARKVSESFADEQIRASKAFPKERDAIASLFLSALKADGGGTALFGDDGALIEADNVKAVREAFEARPAHALFVQEIQGGDPTDRPTLNRDKPDPAKQAALMDMTPLGRKAKAMKEGK